MKVPECLKCVLVGSKKLFLFVVAFFSEDGYDVIILSPLTEFMVSNMQVRQTEGIANTTLTILDLGLMGSVQVSGVLQHLIVVNVIIALPILTPLTDDDNLFFRLRGKSRSNDSLQKKFSSIEHWTPAQCDQKKIAKSL